MWSYSVKRLVFITLHAASLLRGACSTCWAALHPHLQTVAPEVVGIVAILSQTFISQSFLYAFSKGRSWDFQVAFPSSFISAQGWCLRAVVLRQHPCSCWLHTLPWHSNPVSQFQDQTCKFPKNFCCFTAFPHIRPQLYPPSYLAPTQTCIYVWVILRKPLCLLLSPRSDCCFYSTIHLASLFDFYQGCCTSYFAYLWSFSKGADELPGTSESTVSLLRAAALFLRSYEKSLLSWVSNWELR